MVGAAHARGFDIVTLLVASFYLGKVAKDIFVIYEKRMFLRCLILSA